MEGTSAAEAAHHSWPVSQRRRRCATQRQEQKVLRHQRARTEGAAPTSRSRRCEPRLPVTIAAGKEMEMMVFVITFEARNMIPM